ncbi:hypothetical protein O9G_005579 [Rozella allomycis CSF55]|uniref:Uncharacterized protein n=1 Tax=Rozella allomycis (strain CSF55) TaxID=988480 RepID=A0A075B3P0_ROZAC|nr:hypothetical protein O9G_005579 [Rozella allomycis CSF55]|eukprot:EPZ37037.1 hypothetical protein O9G_005579 [Rozella allomycis CSF55]
MCRSRLEERLNSGIMKEKYDENSKMRSQNQSMKVFSLLFIKRMKIRIWIRRPELSDPNPTLTNMPRKA